jgi:hypothetical protein
MNESPVIVFAEKLYGGNITADIKGDKSDWYQYDESNGGLYIKTGTERGILYAVYDILSGKKSGNEKPEFSIRGLNLCESINRHTPKQLIQLIDRMGQWRMNTIIIHSNYGYLNHKKLIDTETAKRGIDLVHYTYSNLSFMENVDPSHFAKDDKGQLQCKELECETRLCVSDHQGLEEYSFGLEKYLKEHSDYTRMLFATADGRGICSCPQCINKNAIQQWEPVFDRFFDKAVDRHREMISYVQRFSVPDNLERIRHLDRVMFDSHMRYPRTPLGAWHAHGKEGAEPEIKEDPRAKNTPINVYLLDRLKEWRDTFHGEIYLFENLMIQGIFGCPRPNTSLYLEDLKILKEIGINGVVYECFEPGIKPFLPTFDIIAKCMWNISCEYNPGDFEQEYLANGKNDTNSWALWPGCERWDKFIDEYPMIELAQRHYNSLRYPSSENDRKLLAYVLDTPSREELDWLYIAFRALQNPYKRGEITVQNSMQEIFLKSRKLWDAMEQLENPRDDTVSIIENLYANYL